MTGRGSSMRKLIPLGLAHSVGARYVLHIRDCDNAEEYRHRGALIKSLIGSGS
jgi:hypothetical protein